jgi:DNA repair protein RAD50
LVWCVGDTFTETATRTHLLQTIIESLKYATTGVLPPNSHSGQAFIHDPQVLGVSDVMAQVKIGIRLPKDKRVVAVRSMRLTQKRKTLKFQSIDGALIHTDPVTGESTSVSVKCVELDRTIPQLMGVSRPILEHVIFCHQEESNWPLTLEGKRLKEKFDEIFSATRYSKALEEIKKLHKDKAAELRALAAELETVKEKRTRAQDLKDEVAKKRRLLEDATSSLETVKAAIAAASVGVCSPDVFMLYPAS